MTFCTVPSDASSWKIKEVSRPVNKGKLIYQRGTCIIGSVTQCAARLNLIRHCMIKLHLTDAKYNDGCLVSRLTGELNRLAGRPSNGGNLDI